MAHTNSTTNYGLPQFITTDKPAWLTDVNTAYADIDLAMKNNADAATTAGNNAVQALSDASAAATTASGADAKASGAIASISDIFDATSTYAVGDLVIYNSLLYICTVAITVPGAWTGSTNWDRITIETVIDLKQNKTDNSLYTANKTVVGAINETFGAVNSKQDVITEHDESVTLTSNSYVQPFTTYAEVNVTSHLITNRLVGILLLGSSTTNPVTYSYNNGYVRVYGSKNETITVRLLLTSI